MKNNVVYFSTVNKSCEQKQVTVLSAAQRVPSGGKGHVSDMANGFVRSRVNVRFVLVACAVIPTLV